MAETTNETRIEWIAVLDKLEVLEPRVVFAGHKKPDNEDNPKIFAETRDYIRDFNRLNEITETTQELYHMMLELYPNRANPGALWGAAKAAKS